MTRLSQVSLGLMRLRQPGLCLFWYWLALPAALLHPWGRCSLPCLSCHPCCKVWKSNLQIQSFNWRAVCGRIPPLPRHYVSSSSSPTPQPWQGLPAKTSAICLFVFCCKTENRKVTVLFYFFIQAYVFLTKQMFPSSFSLLVEGP